MSGKRGNPTGAEPDDPRGAVCAGRQLEARSLRLGRLFWPRAAGQSVWTLDPSRLLGHDHTSSVCDLLNLPREHPATRSATRRLTDSEGG